MKIIACTLFMALACLQELYAQHPFFQSYLNLFPEINLPYELNREKINALKTKPIPKEYLLFTSSVKARDLQKDMYPYMKYYPIGKYKVSEKIVILFVFDDTGSSVFVYTHNLTQKDSEYKYFDNICSLRTSDDYLKIDADKNVESYYYNQSKGNYNKVSYKINSAGKVAYVKGFE